MVLSEDYPEISKKDLDILRRHFIIEDTSVEMTEELIEKVLKLNTICREVFISYVSRVNSEKK